MARRGGLLEKLKGALLLVAIVVNGAGASIHQNFGCPLVGLLPFTKPSHLIQNEDEAAYQSQVGFSHMASIQLAMDHFNARDATVVPQLKDLATCGVYFPKPLFLDSGRDAAVSMRAMLGVAAAAAAAISPHEAAERLPCAVLGPGQDKAARQVDSITDALRVPLVLANSESDLLLSSHYPHTLGTVLSTRGRAKAMMDFFARSLKRDYLAVLTQDAPPAQDLASMLQETGSESDVRVLSFVYRGNQLGPMLQDIKATGVKTIFVNVDDASFLPQLAPILQEQDMFGTEYMYVLSPSAVSLDRAGDLLAEQEPDSPMYQLLAGSLIFDRLDRFRLEEGDKFLAAWKRQNATFVERLNLMHPLANAGGIFEFQAAKDDYFQTHDPVHYASFLYDAVMTIGFGACEQWSSTASNDPDDEGPDLDFWERQEDAASATTASGQEEFDISNQGGVFSSFREKEGATDPLMLLMRQSEFEGASGLIRFRDGEKVRNPQDVAVGVYNIRPPMTEEAVDGERKLADGFRSVLAAIWSSANNWLQKDEVLIVYRDGSVTPPVVTREILEQHFLSKWVRGIGLFLLGLSWVLSFGCMFFTWKLGGDYVVKRSQPFFLQMLCCGSIILSASIFTLSWDEGAGWTDDQLDMACIATPWLFILGQLVTFSALFTKLRRLDRVLSFRRATVTVRNVMGPKLVLVVAAVVVLTLWTILDPWTWERELISEIPSETYGECQSDHFWAFFGPLMGLIVLAEGLTAFFAWKTNDVPEDFRETNTVVTAICTQLQGWLMGVPILAVLGNSSTDATYFGRVLLIWIFSVSSVGIVVAPKIWSAWRLRRNPNETRKIRGNVSSGKSGVRVSGVSHPSLSASMNGAGASSTYSASTYSASMSYAKNPRSVSIAVPDGTISEEDDATPKYKPDPGSMALSSTSEESPPVDAREARSNQPSPDHTHSTASKSECSSVRSSPATALDSLVAKGNLPRSPKSAFKLPPSQPPTDLDVSNSSHTEKIQNTSATSDVRVEANDVAAAAAAGDSLGDTGLPSDAEFGNRPDSDTGLLPPVTPKASEPASPRVLFASSSEEEEETSMLPEKESNQFASNQDVTNGTEPVDSSRHSEPWDYSGDKYQVFPAHSEETRFTSNVSSGVNVANGQTLGTGSIQDKQSVQMHASQGDAAGAPAQVDPSSIGPDGGVFENAMQTYLAKCSKQTYASKRRFQQPDDLPTDRPVENRASPGRSPDAGATSYVATTDSNLPGDYVSSSESSFDSIFSIPENGEI